MWKILIKRVHKKKNREDKLEVIREMIHRNGKIEVDLPQK